MRILPSVSQPTLNTFRKEVYRPRLALLLLILLLVGGDREKDQHLSIKAINDHSQPVDRLVETSPSTSPFLRSWDRFSAPFFASKEQDDAKVKRLKSSQKASEDEQSKKATGSEAKFHNNDNNKSASTSALSFSFVPMGIQHLYISGKDALYAIIPLHILWIIRLGGMMIEDTMVRVRRI